MTSIKRNFISGSFWVVVGRGSSNLSGFIIFVLLARFLGPAEFGLVAFAALFIDVTRALALAGTPQALVQREVWDDGVASTAFWTNITFALLFAGFMSGVIAPIFGKIYDPRLSLLISVLCLTFVIDAARATHEAKLQREFRFRTLATRSFAATLFGGIIGVCLAVYGAGAWALVAGRLSSSVVQTFFVWSCVGWTPRLRFSIGSAKSLLRFGAHLSGAAILGQLNTRAMDIVIGWYLGPTAVGMFRVGGRGVDTIRSMVIGPMQATALSAFSRLHDNASVGRAYLRLTKACGIVAFPAYFGLAVVAQDFIVTFIGPEWADSGLVMAMLAVMGGAATLSYFSQPALAAVGRSDWAFLTSIGTVIGNFIAALITVPFGIAAVALGGALRTYCTLPLGFHFLRRATGVTIQEAAMALFPSFICSLLMVGILVGLRITVLKETAPWFRLCIDVPLGAAIYSSSMLIVGRKLLIEMREELHPVFSRFRRKRGKERPLAI